MKYIASAVILVALLMGMQGCSSSSTPSTPADYYKGLDKIGNYWIYQNNEIDTNGNVVTTSSFTDSTWIQGLSLVDGKQATIMISHSVQQGQDQYDTTIVYRDGTKLYAYVPISTIPFDTSSAPPASKWVLAADQSATGSWLVSDTVSSSRDITMSGIDLTIKVKMWINVTHLTDTSLTVASGTTYKTPRFSIGPNLSGTLTPKKIPLSQSIKLAGGNRVQAYADGVALVYERMEPTTLTIGDGGLVPPIKNSGSLRTLLRYHIQ